MFDWCWFNRPSRLNYIRGGWTSRARKGFGFTSKSLIWVQFGWVGPNFPKLFGLKPGCTSRVVFQSVSDLRSKSRRRQSCSSRKNVYLYVFPSESILRVYFDPNMKKYFPSEKTPGLFSLRGRTNIGWFMSDEVINSDFP